MSNGASILFVNWGTPDKEYTLRAAQEKGLNIYLASFKTCPNWIQSYISDDRRIITNTYDSDLLITDVARYMENHHKMFDGVTTFFEMNIVQTADLASVLHKPFVNPVAARQSSANKLLMRLACMHQGVPTPKFAVFSTADEGLKQLHEFRSPVVIKAIRSGHSYGVMKVSGKNRNEFENNFRYMHELARKQLDANFDEWMRYYHQYKKYFLIEEFIEGKVFSVDGIKQDRQIIFSAITEYEVTRGPYLLQNATFIPSGFSLSLQKTCKLAAYDVIGALGFDNCGFHIEMKLSKNGPILLEAAARLPGGKILDVYKEVYGVNLAHLFLDLCIGKKLKPINASPRLFALIESKFTMKSGVVSDTQMDVPQMSGLTVLSALTSGQRIQPTMGIPAMYLYIQFIVAQKNLLTVFRKFIHTHYKISIEKIRPDYIMMFYEYITRLLPPIVEKKIFHRGLLKFIIKK